MKRLSGGIDVESASHHITILDEEDHILFNQKVSHQLNKFTESIKQFKKIERKEKGVISFALEGKNGYSAPFDRILLDQGFTLGEEEMGSGLEITHFPSILSCC